MTDIEKDLQVIENGTRVAQSTHAELAAIFEIGAAMALKAGRPREALELEQAAVEHELAIESGGRA